MKEKNEESNVNTVLMLENKIFEEFCNHRILKSEVDLIEKRLDSFMVEYYQNIGDVIEKIEYIDSVLAANEIKTNIKKTIINSVSFEDDKDKDIFIEKVKNNRKKSIEDIKPANDDSEEEFINSQMDDEDDDTAFNKEINRIYRSVVKFCHPDSHNADPDAKEAFSMLHNSYKNKDLKTLLTLERIFIENPDNNKSSARLESKEKRVAILEEQYLKIKSDNEALSNRKNLLRDSDLFVLQRRIKWANMCGQDMLLEIKQSAEQELDKKISVIEKMGITISSIEQMSNI